MDLLERRRRDAEGRVLRAIDTLRPEHSGPLAIQRLSGLRPLRAAAAIVRLTHSGAIEEAAIGRRTVYRRVAG